jgi:thiol-disulfide isomerase/thioredoxin
MLEQINRHRRRFLGTAAMSTVAASLGMIGSVMQQALAGAVQLPIEREFPSLSGATGWLNSQPLTVLALRGNVVLIQFWTYTCINWLRTLPYVRAWAEKYKNRGLVVIGVHTPEFPFEKDPDNVRWAAKEMRVEYPVALDPDYAVWRAFSNHYWPAVYIADAEGRIRHHQFGEGGYDECERVIQRLLREVGRDGIGDDLVSPTLEGFEVQADWTNLESPETYLGSDQAQNFVGTDVPPRQLEAQPVGSRAGLDDRGRRERAERSRRADRVPLPRARRPPGPGSTDARNLHSLPRARRR